MSLDRYFILGRLCMHVTSRNGQGQPLAWRLISPCSLSVFLRSISVHDRTPQHFATSLETSRSQRTYIDGTSSCASGPATTTAGTHQLFLSATYLPHRPHPEAPSRLSLLICLSQSHRRYFNCRLSSWEDSATSL